MAYVPYYENLGTWKNLRPIGNINRDPRASYPPMKVWLNKGNSYYPYVSSGIVLYEGYNAIQGGTNGFSPDSLIAWTSLIKIPLYGTDPATGHAGKNGNYFVVKYRIADTDTDERQFWIGCGIENSEGMTIATLDQDTINWYKTGEGCLWMGNPRFFLYDSYYWPTSEGKAFLIQAIQIYRYEWGGQLQTEYTGGYLEISEDYLHSEDFHSRYGYFYLKEVKDPNDDDDDDHEGGGDGEKDKTPDPVPIPDLPSLTGASAGFVTLYKLSPAEMSVFANDCFADDIWQAISLFFQNPMDFIAGVNIVPFEPPGDTFYTPKFGTFYWRHAYEKISNTMVSINMGDLYIKPYWGSFLDYSPFTKILIWLPYIGYQELPVDEVMGKTINVTYHCDCLSGACIAYISTSAVSEVGPAIPMVLAQFSGNVCVQCPTSSVAWDSVVSNAINILTTMASAAAGAGAAAGLGESEVAAQGAEVASNYGNGPSRASFASQLTSASMNSVAGMKANTVRNGTPGSTAGYMGVQYPYIVCMIPRQSKPSNYIDMKGYPSNVAGPLSTCSGYVEVEDIQLNDIPATIDEITEIYELLKGGVLI